MKNLFIVLITVCIASFFGEVNAQQVVDHFKDAQGNTYHQLFVDFHIAEIIEIKYAADDTPIHGELSTDGYSVVIKNYPGDKSVKLVVKNDKGEEKTITKSKCFIDPVLLEL